MGEGRRGRRVGVRSEYSMQCPKKKEGLASHPYIFYVEVGVAEK